MKSILNKKRFIVTIIGIILSMLISSFTYIVCAGFTYQGVTYNTTKDLADLAKKKTDLFLKIPASTILNKTFTTDSLALEDNITCVEHWNKTPADKTSGKVWRIVDINPNGLNTLQINGKNKGNLSAIQKKYLNAIAEAAAKCKNDSSGWESDTKDAFASLVNSSNVKTIFELNGQKSEQSFLTNNRVKQLVKTYLQHGEEASKATETRVTALSSENSDRTKNDNGTFLGPFQYESDNNKNVSFNSIKIIGKDNNQTVFEKTIDNPSKEDLYRNKLGTRHVANGSIKPKQDFYIKVDNEINSATKIKVEITVKGVEFYKTRILLFRNYGQQTFACYSVGNGKTQGEDQTLTYEFEAGKGIMKIKKVDADTGRKLEGVGFKIKTGNKYLKGKYDNTSGEYTANGYADKRENATVFEKYKNGEIIIKDVEKGTYKICESKNPNYGYESIEITSATTKVGNGRETEVDSSKISENKKTVTISFDGNAAGTLTTTIKIKDKKQTGKLTIEKRDKDSNNLLGGVEFKIQRYNGNAGKYQYIKVDGKTEINGRYTFTSMNFTDNKDEATIFKTPKSGENKGKIILNGILKGTYRIVETSVGNNSGYTTNSSKVDTNYVYWKDANGTWHTAKDEPIKVTIAKDADVKLEIQNERKLINISGFAWSDIASGKNSELDNVFHNENYQIGNETYEGRDILLPDIKVRLKNKDNNTIVKETTTNSNGEYKFENISISNLDKYYIEFEYDGLKYTTVTPMYGNNIKINSKATETLNERKGLNDAFAKITNNGSIDDRNHGCSINSNGVKSGEITYINDVEHYKSTYNSSTYNTNITANTNSANYSLYERFNKHNEDVVENGGSLELKYINLGLHEREKPQMSISEDIENVDVSVNNYSYSYKYAKREDARYTTDWTQSAFNVGVKFSREFGNGYYRAIYPSDIKYSQTVEDSKKLKVYVTYSITVKNLSNSLKMTANELVNYYDNRYTIVDSWIDNGEGMTKVTWKDGGQTGNNFRAAHTTSLADKKLNSGDAKEIHIKYQVSESAVLDLLNDKATLSNVSEIYSYSSYYGKEQEGCNVNEAYAGIDLASAPGNAKPEIDSNNELIKTTYEADTDSAPSLILEAKGARTIEGTVFEDSTTITNNERKGDGIYSANESTIAEVQVDLMTKDEDVAEIYPHKEDSTGIQFLFEEGKKSARATTTTDKKGHYEFKGIEPEEYYIKYTYENGKTVVCDTNGQEVKKINVQDYKSTILTSDNIKNAFNNTDETKKTWYKKDKDIRYSDARDNIDIRKNIDEELTNIPSANNFEYKSMDANTPKMFVAVDDENLETDSSGSFYELKISNIDFGIVERPHQAANLDKQISHIKVTQNDGKVLVDGDPNDDLKYVTKTYNNDNKIDKIYITVDNELIHNAHIEIDYKLILTNGSELDYAVESYDSYFYTGSITDNDKPITFTSATLIDFVDSEIALKAENEKEKKTWNVIEVAKEGIGIDITEDRKAELLKKYSTVVTANPLEGNKKLAPGDSTETIISVERLIGDYENELVYENNGAVTQINKNGGSNVPTNEPDEIIPDIPVTAFTSAPPVTIVPPTGTTNHNVLYAIISAISLTVLGFGTYGIRKFIKK